MSHKIYEGGIKVEYYKSTITKEHVRMGNPFEYFPITVLECSKIRRACFRCL